MILASPVVPGAAVRASGSDRAGRSFRLRPALFPRAGHSALLRSCIAVAALAAVGGCSLMPRSDRGAELPSAPIVAAQSSPPTPRTSLVPPTAAQPAPATAPVESATPTSPPAATPAMPAPLPAASAPLPRIEQTVSPVVPPVPGLYRCEANRRAMIRRVSDDGQRIVLNWSGSDHTLQAVRATRGPPIRWQDARAGLAWIVAEGRSLLLDTRQGHTLASDCRL